VTGLPSAGGRVRTRRLWSELRVRTR
jgi:hypothetical protein